MGRKNFKAGFTLIEVMIVVSVVGFLGFLVINFTATQIFKGNDAKRKADLNRIQIALEEFEKDKNCYPQSVSCTVSGSLVPYLSKIPCDQTTNLSYDYRPLGVNPSCPSYYTLSATLQNSKDPNYPIYTVKSPNAP